MSTSKRQLICLLIAIAGIFLIFIFSVGTAASFYDEQLKSGPVGNPNFDATTDKKLEPAAVNQDLSIVKSHTGDFIIGETGVYTIEVTNLGPETSEGPITVTDTLPIGLSPAQASGEEWEPCEFIDQEVTCVYSNTMGLPPDEVLPPIILNVDVAVAATPVVTNTVTLSNTNDSGGNNNTASDRTTIVSADLAVEKSVTPLIVAEGDEVVFSVNVTNHGPSPTSGVVLTDTLPAELLFTDAVTTTGVYTPTTGLWDIGDMQVDELATLVLTATVDLDTLGQTITNTAYGLTSTLHDYDTANNSASATIRVKSTTLSGLVTDKVTSAPVAGATTVFTDSLDHVFTTLTSASGWYTFTETVTDTIAPGNALVEVSDEDYASASSTIDIQGSIHNSLDFQLDTTDLLVTKSDGESQVFPGDEIIYTLTISNTGSITATEVVITDVLATNLTYLDDTSGIDPDEPTDGTFVWELDSPLSPNEAVTFDLEAQVDWALSSATAQVKNEIRASTGSPEANLVNNIAQDVNTATGSPDVEIVKSVSPTQVRRGQRVVYTMVVSNDGTAAVTDVIVTDTFSQYLNLTSATTTKGTVVRNNSTRTVTVKIPVLEDDETETIKVFATVNSLATSNLTVSNRADLTYTFGGADKDLDSNSVSLRILGTTTLPGTGGIEPSGAQKSATPWSFIIALVSSLFLAAFGLLALAGGFWAMRRGSDWASWLLRMGVLLSAVAIVFGLAGWALWEKPEVVERTNMIVKTAAPWIQGDNIQDGESQGDIPDEPEFSLDIADYYVEEPETLPDYPIPTPNFEVLDESEPPPDTSPVERIVMPSIGVDTVVKFVPYDGITWLIGGLKQEVAWMGDTSWPGLGGNTALAGHVSLSEGGDGPFRNLVELAYGDQVYLYTEENMYVYQVNEQQTVDEDEVSVLDRGEDARITLITCTNWDEDREYYIERLIVQADLVDVYPLSGGSQSTISGNVQLAD